MKTQPAQEAPLFEKVEGVRYPAKRGAGYLTTEDAALLLGMTPASARHYLRRQRLRPSKEGGRNLWRADKVQALAEKMPPLCESPIKGYITREEACRRLNRCLRTLRTWEAEKRLTYMEVRMGSRCWHIYPETQVARLAAANNNNND